MATSSAMSTSNQYIKYTISITQNSQSVADNTSNVTVSVRFYRTNTGYTSYGAGTVYCKINGTRYSASVTPSQGITNGGIVLFTKTLNISHGSDGKKTLTCSAWISHDVVTSSEQSYSQALSTIYRASKPSVSANSVQMGKSVTIYTNSKSSSFHHSITVTFGSYSHNWPKIYGNTLWQVPDLANQIPNALSGTARITCITYNGSTKIGTETCSVTVTVPDATKPVFTNGNVIIGASNPIQTNAGSASFTHLITYSFNGKTGNVNDEKVKSGIVWWTPADLASYIASTSGKGSITCTTYHGTEKVGTSTIEFTAVVPNNETFQPMLSEFSISPAGELPAVFEGLYIQSKTGVQARFTASSTYSTIASYKLTADGRNYTGNPATSVPFTREGNFTVTGIVTDVRGFPTSKSEDITVIPYHKPIIEPHRGYSSIICERSTQDGTYDDAGTYLHIKCRRNYAPVEADGVQKNFCTLQYQYKMADGGWSQPYTLLDGSDTLTVDYECILPDVVSQADKSYTIRLIVTDTIGSSEPYEFPIATADVTMHLGNGGYGVAIGKYSEATAEDKKFECAWNAVFDCDVKAKSIHSGENGEIFHDGIIEQGTSGIWTYIKYESGRAVCWGSFDSVKVNAFVAWGALFVSKVNDRIDYPFAFVDRPVEIARVSCRSLAVLTLPESGGNGMNSTTQTAVYSAARGAETDSTLYSLILDLFVVGRWK